MNHNLLENITSVEISTVIVDEIVDEIFIPWEAYQAIYYLSRFSLEQSTVNLSLHGRYLQLRRQLELAYCLLAIDSGSSLYHRSLVGEIKRDLPILSEQNVDWENIPTRLPEPVPGSRQQTMSQVNKLLCDRSFTNVLQQLNQRKLALDRRDRALGSSAQNNLNNLNNITDTTYAQTSLQLNGKIVNRYSQAILARSDRHLLLQLHQQSTATGEQQWRDLVRFMFSLIAKQ